MSFAWKKFSAILLGVLTIGLCGLNAPAQSSTNLPSSVPPLPVAKSPVDAFRDLLAMDSATLRTALSNRSETARQRLTTKIREYKAMDPDERELRLQTTELRWHLLQLMRMPGTNRTERLADIRADLRPLIESRLARWEALPTELREQFLQSEQALSLLLQIGKASDRMRKQLVAAVPPEQRESLNHALARLDAMSPTERERAFDVFENVFTMTPAERQKAQRMMSDQEKQQMERTLADFGKLPHEERRRCILAYKKFAGMTSGERVLFYRNVQQWEKMSPKERQQWRDVVKNVEILPPLPEVKPKLPPVPPEPQPRFTTNKT